ncbi:hypothetical protein [Streptosporangium sp. NPDC006007]|uniref:hypothetical protein n=1 Tax=Streptosporangium sp. NPDC006007 TaxID=3154575 RepID=UPI0033A174AF
MPDIANELPHILLEASEAYIRAGGAAPPPQLHLLAEDLDVPYLGYMVCRRFYRGADAASAVADLGLLPSVLVATRIIAVWEDSDMRTAFELSGAPFATAMVILDARLDGHTLHWHPFGAGLSAPDHTGESEVVIKWGISNKYENVDLLAPFAALLQVWREFRKDDLEQTVTRLREAGYELNWARAVE